MILSSAIGLCFLVACNAAGFAGLCLLVAGGFDAIAAFHRNPHHTS